MRARRYPDGMTDPEYFTINVSSGEESSTPIKLPEFPPETLHRFSEFLQTMIVPHGALDLNLRTVALSYRSQKNDTGETNRAAKRQRQRKAARTVSKALGAVDQLQAGDIVPFVMAGGDDAYKKLRALNRLLEHWAPVMQEVAARRLPRGREERDLLTSTCGWLKFIYEEQTGEPATHNTMTLGIDIGQPVSPFGRFVTAFFEHVDPSVTASMLVEPLRQVVWPSRRPMGQ